MQTESGNSAFSHLVNVRRVARKGMHVRYDADDEVCAAIAQEYGLLQVKKFHAQSHVVPWKRDGVKLTSSIEAEVVQPCAVTGEPIDQRVEEDFELIYVPEGSKFSKPRVDSDGELILDPTGEDPPEQFSGDSVDLALSWLEHFALGINPFARIEGAEFDPKGLHDQRDSPFSVLEKLKQDSKKA